MRFMRRLEILSPAMSGLLALAASIGACNPVDYDFYSEVAGPCDYRVRLENMVPTEPEEIRANTLTKECKAALDRVLLFDEESFVKAPVGMRDKVMEAFQVLIGYPLGLPPEHRILGVAPYSIPLSAVCILAPQLYRGECLYSGEAEENPDLNRNVFNYVLNQIDIIRFVEGDEGSTVARYEPDRETISERVLYVYSKFWNDDMVTNLLRNRFILASTLVHEARHGDEQLHTRCGSGDFDCDTELGGPYGLDAIWKLALLHGSSQLKTEDGKDILRPLEVGLLGLDVCLTIAELPELGGRRILRLPDELTSLVDATDCNSIKNRWVLEREGLPVSDEY